MDRSRGTISANVFLVPFSNLLRAACACGIVFVAGCSKPEDGDGLADIDSRPYEEILEEVETDLPAGDYMTNDFLPEFGEVVEFPPLAEKQTLRLGMPWILNDQFAAVYVAIEKGYFDEVGIELELRSGGPGIDHLKTLSSGFLDLATTSHGKNVILVENSATPMGLMAIAAFQKDNPYAIMALDFDVPQDQVTEKKITPYDMVGKKLGVGVDDRKYPPFLARKLGLPEDFVKVQNTGNAQFILQSRVIDFRGVWIQNEPRYLERQGIRNWTHFMLKDYGWNQYCDVVVVTKQFAEENSDLLKRFCYALSRGVEDWLNDPEEAVDITVGFMEDGDLDPVLVKRRFELERAQVVGTDGTAPLQMTEKRWNELAAILVQYGITEAPSHKKQ